MKTVVKLVTPAMAAKILEGNIHNRPLRDGVVQRYARDMMSGDWPLHHQGIAINTEGTLEDGQHRLWAIVESNVAVSLNYSTGVPVTSRKVIDDHLQRTMVDALQYHSEVDVKVAHIAIVKLLLRGFDQGGRPSRMEVDEGLRRFAPAIEFTHDCFRTKLRGMTGAPGRVAVALAYYSHDPEMIKKFAYTLQTGLKSAGISDAQHSSAMLLRNHCLFPRPHKRHRRTDVYQRAQRALYAFLRNEKLFKLYPATRELFPLPDQDNDVMYQQSVRRIEIQSQRNKVKRNM